MTAADALDSAPPPAARPVLGGTGLALPLTLGLSVAGHVAVARRAEQLGYARIWAAEAGTADAFGLLTACAAATTRVALATGVVPIQTRTPALMAACAATLQDSSDGRFCLGVGVSSPTVVSRWNGLPWDDPLTRIREYVRIVVDLLAGERVSFEGRHYRVDGYRLLMPVPDPAPPVLVGALNETMLGLAGEVSAGALLNFIAASAVPDAVSVVCRGAGNAGGCTGVFVRVCVTDDVAAARAWARRELMGYVTVPAYRRAFDRQGWAAPCAEAMSRWAAGDRRGAAESLPDEFVDALFLAGPAEDVRARFAAFRESGVDEPIVFPFSGQTDPDSVRYELQSTMEAMAPTG
jgi:probable F420-dependent oxidoreductase